LAGTSRKKSYWTAASGAARIPAMLLLSLAHAVDASHWSTADRTTRSAAIAKAEQKARAIAAKLARGAARRPIRVELARRRFLMTAQIRVPDLDVSALENPAQSAGAT
jgi:hypothetical protein